MKDFILNLWYRYKHWRYERKCIKYFGCKPEKVYLSKEDYDHLVERINQPPDPESIAKIKKILERKPPWND